MATPFTGRPFQLWQLSSKQGLMFHVFVPACAMDETEAAIAKVCVDLHMLASMIFPIMVDDHNGCLN